jgi:hypothetical protein
MSRLALEHDVLPASAPLAVLPAVHRPGTHVTPQGTIEVSTAAFADEVLRCLPPEALFFRMGEVVGSLIGSEGSRQFVDLDADRTRLLVDRHVRIVASGEAPQGDGLRLTYVPCGKDLAGLVLAAARGSAHVRPLRGVVNYPVFVGDFDLTVSGYNESAQVFYDEPEHLRGLVPRLEAPLEALDEVLEGFPFREEASRENSIALMLTLATRFALDGNIPGFLIQAHRERTGKTYLARTLCAAVRGEEPALLQFGSTEEEREKRITSELMRGRTAAVFDNLPAGEEIDSPALAMLLTTRWWTGRVLGRSQTPSLPNEMTLTLTGNNIGATGEIAQRLVPIHLEATSANPQEQTGFPHEDPVAFARSRQRQALEAILGMVFTWKSLGCPAFRDVTFGGFESWTRSVGGILVASGSKAFLGNLKSWQDSADEFGADASALLEDWAREAGVGAGVVSSPPVQAKSIFQRAERLDLFARYRQGTSDPARAATFGKRVLKVIVDRIFRIRWRDGDGEHEGDVRVRKSASGSNSLYTLEVGR